MQRGKVTDLKSETFLVKKKKKILMCNSKCTSSFLLLISHAQFLGGFFYENGQKWMCCCSLVEICVFRITVTWEAKWNGTEERMHRHKNTRLTAKNTLLFFHIAQYPLSRFVYPHVSFLFIRSIFVSTFLVCFRWKEDVRSFSKCCLI